MIIPKSFFISSTSPSSAALSDEPPRRRAERRGLCRLRPARQLDEEQAAHIFIARYNQACDLALSDGSPRPAAATSHLLSKPDDPSHGHAGLPQLHGGRERRRPLLYSPAQEFQAIQADLAFPVEPFAPGH